MLKKNGQISHNMFSIYTSMNPGNSTHLILGGIDENGIKEGEKLKYIKTMNQNSWALPFEKISMFEDSENIKTVACGKTPTGTQQNLGTKRQRQKGTPHPPGKI